MSLEKYRNQIDEIDQKLLQLLNARARCALEIGEIKSRERFSVLDRDREKRILTKLNEHNSGPLGQEAIEKIFSTIIKECRELQHIKNINKQED